MRRDNPASLRPWVPLTFTLGVSSLGCLLMVALRVTVTGSIRYAALLWNLFLAWVPYLLALGARRVAAGRMVASGVRPLWLLLAAAWLIFYPNAPYILTDFIHLIRAPNGMNPAHPSITRNALLWYDIVLHSTFAFLGHIIGLISLLIVHRTVQHKYGRRWGWVVAVIAAALGGYGIYLGRFERLNSWDIVRDAGRTLRAVFSSLTDLKALLASLCFASFIFLTYIAVHALYQTARRSGA